MISSKSLYFPLLRLTLFCTVLVIGRAVFDPNLGEYTPFTFPSQMPLKQSKLVEGNALVLKPLPTQLNAPSANGYQYKYQVNDRSFNVQVHYLTATSGDIPVYLEIYGLDHQSVTVNPTTKQGQTGFYQLFEHDRTAYLSSCINSQGSSTINREQFFANRNAHDLTVDRILPVVLGTEDVRDTRCLWVTISTPIDDRSMRDVHQQLEAVWQEVYAWWMPRFPKL
jgi:cyanosortase A-associated protein